MSKKLFSLFLCLICFPVSGFAAEKLVFALDLIRHGDRTPTSRIPKVDYYWPEGLGQLTATGMRQEYEMGMEFRKRYVEQQHLLPEKYQYGTVYVRSTDYERTLMSAHSLLTGLYPPGTGPSEKDSGTPGLPGALQPIPIHMWPAHYDDVVLHKIKPEVYERLMQKYVYTNPEWQQKEAALKSQFPRWSELSGMKITKLEDLERLGDALHIHQLHHIAMPDGFTDEEIQTIIDAGDWAFMAEERPKEIAEVNSRKLLTYIANFLQKGSEGKSKLKFVLLSAHDSTLASALALLEAPLYKAPRYASNLNFSVYERSASRYVVKVNYNGKPVAIPACGGTVCDLQKFLKLAAARGN